VKPLEKEPPTSACREARVDRLALAAWPALQPHIFDWKGSPTAAVRELSPERAVADFPRVAEFRWLYANGRWADVGSGANGDGVTSFVEYVAGGCERAKAVDFLEKTLAELDADAA
jgi:hypothetical protein